MRKKQAKKSRIRHLKAQGKYREYYYQKLKYGWERFIGKALKPSMYSLGLAQFYSWIFLILLVVFSIGLSVFLAATTRATLIGNQESYSLLLAENMNRQIFRRFTLPVAYKEGKISLSNPAQYRFLDEIVVSLISGLGISSVRIFDESKTVTYSTDETELGSLTFATMGVEHVFEQKTHYVEVISTMSFFQALFTPNLSRGTFTLRTVYPLTIDFDMGPFVIKDGGDPPTLGGLEIIQDVTSSYQSAIKLQWSILFGFMGAIFILFIILQIIAKTAEHIISERMSENEVLEKELQQNEKLASMGRMVASIAHEVRNPLGIIKSSAEYLLSRKEIDSTQKKLIGAIFDETSRLSVTVNDFLDYARPRDPGSTPIDLVAIINKIWNFLEASFEQSGIQTVFSLPEKLEIKGDEETLYRALYNIFINAQQAIEEQRLHEKNIVSEGGRYIGTQDNEAYTDAPFEPMYLFEVEGFAMNSGKVVLKFSDDGCGFPNDINKVLDPFFTTKDTGTGLGLPIMQSIIKSHKGEISLYNKKSGGAVVKIIFDVNRND